MPTPPPPPKPLRCHAWPCHALPCDAMHRSLRDDESLRAAPLTDDPAAQANSLAFSPAAQRLWRLNRPAPSRGKRQDAITSCREALSLRLGTNRLRRPQIVQQLLVVLSCSFITVVPLLRRAGCQTQQWPVPFTEYFPKLRIWRLILPVALLNAFPSHG